MDNDAPATKPYSYRWAGYALTVVLVVAFFGWAYLRATKLPALYSPANVVRPNPDYDQKMNPPKVQLVDASALPAKPIITTIITNGSVRIEHPTTPNSSEIYPVPMLVHRLAATNTAIVKGTSVSLKYIAYAQMDPAQFKTNTYGFQSIGKLFYPNLQPLTETESAKAYSNDWERKLDCEPGSPTYRFILGITPKTYQFLGSTIFDARTHRNLSQGWASQQTQSGEQMVTMRTALWHDTPVEVVIDLALGEPEIEELEPVVGANFRYGNSRYYLVHAGETAEHSGWSSGNDTRKEYIQIDLPRPEQKQTHVAFVFMGVPTTSFRAFEFDFLDENGKVLSGYGGGSSAGHVVKNFTGSLSAVKKIRVRKYTDAHRFVFSLPSLPNLPPENAKVENLFETRIPYVAFKQPYEQEYYLKRITQLDSSILYGNIPSSVYPRTFTNTTPAEILADYLLLLPPKGELYVNQQTFTIDTRKPWPEELRLQIRNFWEKLRSK